MQKGHTGAYLGLFIVAIRDLIIGDVDKTHLSLLLLQLIVKDLKNTRITHHKKTFFNTNVSFQGYTLSLGPMALWALSIAWAQSKSVVSRQNR